MKYSPRDYYRELLSWIGAIEEVDGDDITQSDAGFPALEAAMLINRARRDVLQVCVDADPAWATMVRTVAWPATTDYVDLADAGAFLPYAVRVLGLVEQSIAGFFSPMNKVSNAEKWRHASAAGGVASRFSPDGDRLWMVPRPATGTQFRFTFIPELDRYTINDLGSARHDEIVPRSAQAAVPVRAALLASTKEIDAERHKTLTALWLAEMAQIVSMAELREMAAPDFVINTRDEEGVSVS